jgi:hypothetical protein
MPTKIINIENTSQIKYMTYKNNRTFFTALQVSLLRQLCGVSYIIVYAGQIMRDLKSPLAPITPVIINSVQFASAFIGIVLSKYFGRRPLMQSATIFLCLINIAIGVSDIF